MPLLRADVGKVGGTAGGSSSSLKYPNRAMQVACPEMETELQACDYN